MVRQPDVKDMNRRWLVGIASDHDVEHSAANVCWRGDAVGKPV